MRRRRLIDTNAGSAKRLARARSPGRKPGIGGPSRKMRRKLGYYYIRRIVSERGLL